MSFCPSIFLAKFLSSAVQYSFVSIESWGVVDLVQFAGVGFGLVVDSLGFCLFFLCVWGFCLFCFNFPFAFQFFFSFTIAWLMLLLVCFVYVCVTNFSLISHRE